MNFGLTLVGDGSKMLCDAVNRLKLLLDEVSCTLIYWRRFKNLFYDFVFIRKPDRSISRFGKEISMIKKSNYSHESWESYVLNELLFTLFGLAIIYLQTLSVYCTSNGKDVESEPKLFLYLFFLVDLFHFSRVMFENVSLFL